MKGLINKKIEINNEIKISRRKILTNRLHFAIQTDNYEEAIYCIDNGAFLDIKSKNTNSLILAAQYGRINILEYLLRKGANVDAKDLMGATALMWASSANNIKIVDMLLEYGADINLPDGEYGSTPIIWWVVNCEDSVKHIEHLVKCGADVSYRDVTGKSCVEYAEDNDNFDVAEYLRKMQKIQNSLQSKLLVAFNDLRVVYKIIKKQENKDERYFDEYYKQVKEVLSQGARLEDDMIRVLLFCAKYYNDDEIIKLCIKQREYKRQYRKAITTQQRLKRNRANSTDE